ncbi:Scr1 family TA system antitoxin-like transcriptional regulator [Streptomyces anulatus]|uniref:Scr1 family TA system antitoxin-like transcriptional regulator n=1 Tax=Streptomyces anulatus TaxID=1892 RepID=UPI00363EF9F2
MRRNIKDPGFPRCCRPRIQVLPHTEWAAARVSPAFVGLSYAQETSPEVIVIDAVANCIILEERDVMASYVHAFDTLRSAALTRT